jgi:hypothetical protein
MVRTRRLLRCSVFNAGRQHCAIKRQLPEDSLRAKRGQCWAHGPDPTAPRASICGREFAKGVTASNTGSIPIRQFRIHHVIGAALCHETALSDWRCTTRPSTYHIQQVTATERLPKDRFAQNAVLLMTFCAPGICAGVKAD